ncbi:hypothetical protein GCM10028791_19320 [Echinicola sediminis]
MMKWIQECCISFKLRKNPINKVENWAKSMEDIKSIHILADSYEDLAVAEETLRSNWPNALEIKKLYYSETEQNEESFSSKSFSLLGVPTKHLDEFLISPADVVLSTVTNYNVYEKYIMSHKTAAYRVGFYKFQKDIPLDVLLAIDAEMDLKTNIGNLLKYLKKII